MPFIACLYNWNKCEFLCKAQIPCPEAKICIKYIQETLKKLCGFSTVCADRADLGSTKTSEQKLKYATFEASFFMFSWAKNDFFRI